jgi:peptidyl-prolyl cis-trans isomerase C
MRFFRVLPFYAVGFCLVGQTPPTAPARPPVAATPVAPSTPVTPAAPAEVVTLPLQLFPPKTIPADHVVIQVGDLKFTSAQMGLILDMFPEGQRAYANSQGRPKFVEQFVRMLLLADEGRRRKLNETDAFKNQVQYFTDSVLATQADLEIKRQVSNDLGLLKAYHEAHKSEYEQVHVRHILIRMQGSPIPLMPGQKDLTEAEALAKAREIRQKLEQGGDFAELALKESNDVGNNSKGGDLGFIKHGQYLPSFEEAVFALPNGGLSEPVKTQYGYHIVKLEERKPTKTFEELRPELEKILGNEAIRKFVEDLKAKTTVVIDPDFGEVAQGPAAPKP